MNDRTTDHATRRAERRDRAMEDVARRAEKNLRDTRFDGVRTLGARRAVIATYGVLVVAIAGAMLLDNALLTIAGFVVGGTASWFLRSLVRAVPDMPDEVLDERQISRRDSAYRVAY
jgi:hypothetical protein